MRPYNVYFGSYDKPFVTRHAEPPTLSNSDSERVRPGNVRDVHVSVLDLGNSKDEKLYKAIWKAAGYNCVKVFNMREQWVFETKNWKVLIHWYVDALMMRTEANQQKLALVKSLLALTNGESENDENIGEESRS